MKILFCTPTFQTITHGPAKFANLIFKINELYPPHEIRILTEDTEKGVPGKIYRCTLIRKNWIKLGRMRNALSYWRDIRRIRKEFKFDCLVFNNAIHGLMTCLFPTAKEIKIVGLINDYECLAASWNIIKMTKSTWVDLMHRPLEKLTTKLLDRTLTCSDFLKSEIERAYHCPEDKIRRLYQAIELTQLPFKSGNFIRPEEQIKILFVKADYRVGGLPVLLQALGTLKEHDFFLTVCGPLMREASSIRLLARSVKNVHLEFKGPTYQRTIFAFMCQHHILCTPSLREGLGMANMEGLAIGIPVVSTKAGGIPEVLDHGANGWLANPGDAKDLASKIEDCLRSPHKRLEKSRRGRKYVEEKFNHSLMLENFLEILSDVTRPSCKIYP